MYMTKPLIQVVMYCKDTCFLIARRQTNLIPLRNRNKGYTDEECRTILRPRIRIEYWSYKFPLTTSVFLMNNYNYKMASLTEATYKPYANHYIRC